MNNELRQTTRGRSRAQTIFWIAVATALVAMLVLAARWGTRWTLPPAKANTMKASYELVDYWDGADVPGGTFDRPMGIAVAPGGDVYVTDARARVVHLDDKGGFIEQWGREGDGDEAFRKPTGVAVAPDGSIYVSDFERDRVQKFTAKGTFLLAFGRSGRGFGEFDGPTGIAVDQTGVVFVADFYNHRILAFGANGSFQRTVGQPGRLGDGALHYPTGLSIAPDGVLLVADAYNYELQRFDRGGRPLDRLGYHLFWLWPRPTSSNRGFDVPTGVAAAPDGLIHVADSGNHRVVVLSERGGYVSAWRLPDAEPAIYSPEQVAVSPDGRTVYATDYAANRIVRLKRIP